MEASPTGKPTAREVKEAVETSEEHYGQRDGVALNETIILSRLVQDRKLFGFWSMRILTMV
jgi:hypothetical protein